jgi:hypothetical protein
VRDPQGAGEVDEEDRARLEWCDEQRLLPCVVGCDRRSQLRDACRDLLPGEVDLSDPAAVVPRLYEASFS